MTHTCATSCAIVEGRENVLPCGAAAAAIRPPNLQRMEMGNLSGVVDAQMMNSESETPRASNESGKKLTGSADRLPLGIVIVWRLQL